MLFDAYKVAVHLSIVDKVSPVLGAFSRQLASAGHDVDALEKKLGRLGQIAKAGGILAGLGVGMLGLLKTPIEEAVKYENALNRFKQMNLGDAINRDADAMARHANAFGNSAAQMMDTIRDLHAAFGSYEEAKHFAPLVARLNAANSTIYGKGHEIDEGETRAMAKVIEMRGGTVNEQSFMRQLELIQKMKNATGGVLDAKTLRAFMSTAGLAGRSLSDEGLLKMSGLIVEQGGQKAGTALMSLYQNLVAGRASNKAKARLAELGLGTLVEERHGSVGGKAQKSIELRNIVGADELQKSPVDWIQHVLLPQLAKKGITDQTAILKTINDILSNRTASGQASITATQLPVILKDAANAKNAKGVAGTISDAQNSTAGRMMEFHARLADLGRVIGENVLPTLTPLIVKATEFSRWLGNNPALVQTLTTSFIGLAAAMSISGTVLLLTSGFGALRIALQMLGPLLGGMGGLGRAAVGRVASSAATSKLMDYLVFAPLKTMGKAGAAGARLLKPPAGVRAFATGFARAIFGPLIVAGQGLLWVASKLGGVVRAAANRVAGTAGAAIAKGTAPLFARLGPIFTTGIAWLGRIAMIGLRAIPVIGWVVMIVTLGVYVVRHWDTIKAKLLLVWGVIKQAAGATWDWITDKLKWAWDGLKAGMKTFVGFFLSQWQWLFNKLIDGINHLLPAAMQLGKFHFADDFNRNDASYSNEGRGHAAPAAKGTPYIAQKTPQMVQVNTTLNMDGRKVAEVVSQHQAKQASRGLGTTGFDGSLGMPLMGAK
jgi:hypothetical protein